MPQAEFVSAMFAEVIAATEVEIALFGNRTYC
jgi:hypothetical protein